MLKRIDVEEFVDMVKGTYSREAATVIFNFYENEENEIVNGEHFIVDITEITQYWHEVDADQIKYPDTDDEYKNADIIHLSNGNMLIHYYNEESQNSIYYSHVTTKVIEDDGAIRILRFYENKIDKD